MNYKDSGVNIEAGNAFVQRLKQKVPSIGGFNGMFEIPSGYEQPVLVSSTDGVGTKIKLCSYLRDYTTIGAIAQLPFSHPRQDLHQLASLECRWMSLNNSSKNCIERTSK